MASRLVHALQPHYQSALERLPPHLAGHVRNVVGVELSVFSLIFAAAAGFLLLSLSGLLSLGKNRNLPPRVPGLPLIGNLLQLGEKKPHRTFTKWMDKYGPIYAISTGLVNNVVISSPELAKEVMVTKYAQVSKRKMPTALQILTRDKTMVAMSDYGEEHRRLKKLVVTNLLAPQPQKNNQPLREKALNNMLDELLAEVMSSSDRSATVDVRDYIKRGLFPFSMFQVFGRDPDSVHVPELCKTVTRWELFDIFVADPLKTVINVDWRDFFPIVKPFFQNKRVIDQINTVEFRKTAAIRALIAEQRKLFSKKKAPDCYLDILLKEASHLTEKQLEQSAWEPVIESADTTLVTTEWIMYELCIHQDVQERLYQEIKSVVGDRMVREDDLPNMPYLNACIKETLRKYPPVPLIPPRYVEEDIQLGGYDIPKGWEVFINIYGINKDPKRWADPEKWDPERVLHDDKLDMGFKDFRILPFGAGKRMCAGIQQAMFIIPMNIAAFVQFFSWKLAEEDAGSTQVEDTVYLTTHKLHPLRAIATLRPGITKRTSSV